VSALILKFNNTCESNIVCSRWSPLSDVNPPAEQQRSEPKPSDEQNRYLPHRLETRTQAAAGARSVSWFYSACTLHTYIYLVIICGLTTLSPKVLVEWYHSCFVSGRSRLQISARIPDILTDVFVIFLSPPSECRDSTLKLGHDCFLPNTFKFIVHLSLSHSTLYNLSY
jgi:hypothetical protein